LYLSSAFATPNSPLTPTTGVESANARRICVDCGISSVETIFQAIATLSSAGREEEIIEMVERSFSILSLDANLFGFFSMY